jgi:8-hydroxy-5-deazaflavin:NADPH oxidoreductase
MYIGMIGAGNIGASAARLFADAGHEVVISNSRGSESLASLVQEIGANARVATVEDAASFGKVVLVAIPFWRYESLPAGPLSGKIVVDAMNYHAGRDGRIDFGDLTSSELFTRRLPDARIVKGFNTMCYETLRREGNRSGGDRLALFIADDDEEAKAVVSRLIEEIGIEPVDTGSLGDGGRKQQPGSPIYNNSMTAEQARETLAGLRESFTVRERRLRDQRCSNHRDAC